MNYRVFSRHQCGHAPLIPIARRSDLQCARATAATILILLVIACSASAQNDAKSRRRLDAFYTEEQAKSGRDQYNQACSACHGEDLRGVGTIPPLAGNSFLERWYSVGDLFSKSSMSMPTDNVNGLSTQAYIDIIAYLLRANGFPAGHVALKNEIGRASCRERV